MVTESLVYQFLKPALIFALSRQVYICFVYFTPRTYNTFIHSKQAAALVERLHVSPFKRKTRVRFPELAPTYHSSVHCIYPSYSLSSIGWGRKMAIPSLGAVLRARKKPGWLWWNSMSLCIRILSLLSFLYARYMYEYNDLNSLYSAEMS